MDAALEAAAHALSAFDPLAALSVVALRDDPKALALRGVAMAQLGDFATARKLLGRAARGLGQSDPRARARCLAALGEVALASRDLTEAGRALDAALRELDAQGDHLNADFVRLQRVRHLVLVGAIGEAGATHRSLDLRKAPPRLRAIAHLIGADIAMRSLDPGAARASSMAARRAARKAAIPSLIEEVDRVVAELEAPVARLVRAGVDRLVGLDEAARIVHSEDVVVDACRRTIRAPDANVSLVTRPVLLGLGVALARAFPGGATRESLAEEAFGARRVNDSIRARLRVEIGRLRRTMADCADIEATAQGYALRPRRGSVVALLPPAPGEASALLALLRGGESWSTSALATALGKGQRTVQRALLALRDEGRVEAIGRGRAQRWVARPPEGFATTLLLVVRGAKD